MTGAVPAIAFTEVTKVFGPHARGALDLLEQGQDKDRIRADTGATVILRRATTPDHGASERLVR